MKVWLAFNLFLTVAFIGWSMEFNHQGYCVAGFLWLAISMGYTCISFVEGKK